jgi:hypothetical protein
MEIGRVTEITTELKSTHTSQGLPAGAGTVYVNDMAKMSAHSIAVIGGTQYPYTTSRDNQAIILAGSLSGTVVENTEVQVYPSSYQRKAFVFDGFSEREVILSSSLWMHFTDGVRDAGAEEFVLFQDGVIIAEVAQPTAQGPFQTLEGTILVNPGTVIVGTDGGERLTMESAALKGYNSSNQQILQLSDGVIQWIQPGYDAKSIQTPVGFPEQWVFQNDATAGTIQFKWDGQNGGSPDPTLSFEATQILAYDAVTNLGSSGVPFGTVFATAGTISGDLHVGGTVYGSLDEGGGGGGTAYVLKTGDTMTGALTINHDAGGTEKLATFKVSDDTTAKLEISNATGSAGIFIPVLYATASGNYTAMSFVAEILTDTGTSSAMVFDARRSGTTIGSRPLFTWRNYTTEYMEMAATGELGIGVSPTSGWRTRVDNAATDLFFGVGQLTTSTSSSGYHQGYSVQRHSTGLFFNHKVATGQLIYFRCGEGAEQGSARHFMRVDPGTGYVSHGGTPSSYPLDAYRNSAGYAMAALNDHVSGGGLLVSTNSSVPALRVERGAGATGWFTIDHSGTLSNLDSLYDMTFQINSTEYARLNSSYFYVKTANGILLQDTNTALLRLAGGSNEILQLGANVAGVTSTTVGNGAVSASFGAYWETDSSGNHVWYGDEGVQNLDMDNSGTLTMKDAIITAASTPKLKFHCTDDVPLPGVVAGELDFSGEDSVGAEQSYAKVIGYVNDDLSSAPTGYLRIETADVVRAQFNESGLGIGDSGSVSPAEDGWNLRVRPYSNTTTGSISLGNKTTSVVANDVGLRLMVSTAGIHYDHKVASGDSIIYRCGEGGEDGEARTFMSVEPGGGDVTFPNDVTISGDLKSHANWEPVTDELPATATITATTYTDVPGTAWEVTLPAAGTYLLTLQVRGYITGGGGVGTGLSCQLYNVTDAAAVAGSEIKVCNMSVALGTEQDTVTGTTIVTVAAAKTIRVQASRSSTITTCQLFSSNTGRSWLTAIRMFSQ